MRISDLSSDVCSSDLLDLATLSYCIPTDSGQLVACFERRNAISIGNMRPFVNAADLSTWPQDHEGLGGNNTIACYAGGGDCVLMGETLLPDPSGRSMVTTGNPRSLNLPHPPVPFPPGATGRGSGAPTAGCGG